MTGVRNAATASSNHRLATRSRLLVTLSLTGFVVALATWLAFTLMPSLPQRTVVMAMYPEGSLNAELVKRYQEILARDGINLKIAPSPGAVESLARLRDPKSSTSVALVPSGITTQQDSPQLVSLGTLFYQPLWVFSRRDVLQGHKQLRGLRVSVGPEGSSSRWLSLKLLGHAGVIDQKSAILLSLTPSESAEKLLHGEIDAAIFVDAWESPAVQQLLNARQIRLESTPNADAFVALYPYLSKLVLPAGVVNMTEPWPPTDVTLIAPKSSLVVRRTLHPAIQYKLLEAAVEIHSPPGMFHPIGQFPAPESIDLPLSPYAREFYKSGTPFLLRHLPFWLVAVLTQPVVLLIPVLVLLIPLLRLLPTIYDWFERRRIYRFYSELRHLEDQMFLATPGRSPQEFLGRLDGLKDRVSHLSVPTSFRPLIYSLRLHIDMVRKEAQRATEEDAIESPARRP